MIACEMAGDAQALQPPPETHAAATQKSRAAGRKRARVESSAEAIAADDDSAHGEASALTQRADGVQPFRTGLWEVSECESLTEGMKLHGNDWESVALVVGTRNAAQVEKFVSRYLTSSKFVRSEPAEGNRHASKQSEAKRSSLPPRPPSARRKSRESHEGRDQPPSSRNEIVLLPAPAQDPRRRARRSTLGRPAVHAVTSQQALVSLAPAEQTTGFAAPGSAVFSPLDSRSFVPTSAASAFPAPPPRQPFTPTTAAPLPFAHVSPAPHSGPRGFTLTENIVESDIHVLLATSPHCRTSWSQFIARLCVLSNADELMEILRRYAVIAQDKIPDACATDALQTCVALQQLTGVARRQFQAAVRSVYFGHGSPGAGLRFHTVYAKHAQIPAAEAEILVYFCVEVAQISEQMEAEQPGPGMAAPLASASADHSPHQQHKHKHQQQLLATNVTSSAGRPSEPRSAVAITVTATAAAAETADVSSNHPTTSLAPAPESATTTTATAAISGGASAPIAVQAEVPHLLQQGAPKLVTCMLAVFADPVTNRNKWKFVRLQSNSMAGVAPVAPLEYLWCHGENRDKYHVIDQSRLFAIPEKHNVFIQPQISPTAIKIRAIIDCVMNLCQIDITKEWCLLDNVWNNMPPPHWWKLHVHANHQQLSELLKAYVMNRYG